MTDDFAPVIPLPTVETHRRLPAPPPPQGLGIEIRIPLVELQKRRLFLATPMYGGQCSGMFVRSVIDLAVLCCKNGIDFNCYFLFNESLITRARNYCCDVFMRSPSTHLLFIDSDIGFDPRDVLAMLSMAGDDSPYDVLTAPYPKKCISWEKVKLAVDKGYAEPGPGRPNATANDLEQFVGDFVFNPRGDIQSFQIGAPVEILEAGTGFMMIQKKVLSRFAAKYPQYMYRPDHVRTADFDGTREIMQYFQAEIDKTDREAMYADVLRKIAQASKDGIFFAPTQLEKITQDVLNFKEERSKRYLSEDYWFCQLAAKADNRIWFCPWMKTSHVGSYVFSGSLAALAMAGLPATADPAMLRAAAGPGAAIPQPLPATVPGGGQPQAAKQDNVVPLKPRRVVQPSSMPKREKKRNRK